MKLTGYINDYSTDFLIDPALQASVIDGAIVIDLLKKGAIDRNDFEGDFEQVLVDDRIVDDARLNLEKIRLGDVVISDSGITVKNDSGQVMILGKDLLDKMGAFLIDEDNKQIIFK